MGAWIEIVVICPLTWLEEIVAPLMGAWIEIYLTIVGCVMPNLCRAPHGRVD